jgi:hypothetical protein
MELPKQIQKKVCSHGIAFEFDCYQCAFEKIKKNQPGVCPHWIPKNESCSICERTNNRKNPLVQRPYIPVSQTQNENKQSLKRTNPQLNNFYSNQMFPSLENYVTPGESRMDFPKPVNTLSGSYKPTTDPTRCFQSDKKETNRSQYGLSDMGIFMERSIEQANFQNNLQNQQLWGNPVLKQNFKSSEEIPYMGKHSRRERKLNSEEDLFLQRSLIQPDMRQGNRFYEIMPSSGRREPLRNFDNNNINSFQQQEARIYQQMDYSKAFDKGANVGRAGPMSFPSFDQSFNQS